MNLGYVCSMPAISDENNLGLRVAALVEPVDDPLIEDTPGVIK